MVIVEGTPGWLVGGEAMAGVSTEASEGLLLYIEVLAKDNVTIQCTDGTVLSAEATLTVQGLYIVYLRS